MARQSALLVLTVHGYEIPSHAVSNDFYRQALDLARGVIDTRVVLYYATLTAACLIVTQTALTSRRWR